MSWFLFLFLPGVLASITAPLDIRVMPESDAFTVVASGEASAAASGGFSGSLALNGSSAELPVTGVARAVGQRLEVSLKLKYRDVPEDWASRFRTSDFDYRLRGRVSGGGAVDWSGTRRWDQIVIEKRDEAMSDFVKLGSIELTDFSLLESAARADVTVRNPLSLALKLASTNYTLFANGREVGSGSTGEIVLRPGQTTTLNLPIDLDHGQLLAAAGSALSSGGEVDGRLRGSLVVRLAGGDVPVPLDLSGRFSLLR